MRGAFIQTLCELAAEDERIWLLTGDLGFSVLEPFIAQFPDRYLNVGVAEQNMTGIAAGLANCGKTVFTYSIANFPTLRCLEQIRNDVCYHKGNVKVVAVGGGFSYGAQGYTHHGIEDLAILRTLPGLTVVAPGDPVETRLATRALAAMNGPAYLRLGKAGEPLVHQAEPQFVLGRALRLREGKDVTLISTGGMLKKTLETANQLAQEGLDVGVLSMHTVKPLDVEAVRQAALHTRAIVTVEEHTLTGGLGSAVAEVLAEMPVRARLGRYAVPDCVHDEIGSQTYMMQLAGDLRQKILATLES